jgi:hypothetical protein
LTDDSMEKASRLLDVLFLLCGRVLVVEERR